MKTLKNIAIIIAIGLVCCVLLLLIFVIARGSKPREVDCAKGEISNCIFISFSTLNRHYIPQNGTIYIYNNNNFTSPINKKELSFANYRNEYNDVLLGFEGLPHKIDAENNYRIVLDDSLYFELSNITITIDTMGKTMTGWATRYKLKAFDVNGTHITSTCDDAFSIPFSTHKIITKMKP